MHPFHTVSRGKSYCFKLPLLTLKNVVKFKRLEGRNLAIELDLFCFDLLQDPLDYSQRTYLVEHLLIKKSPNAGTFGRLYWKFKCSEERNLAVKSKFV